MRWRRRWREKLKKWRSIWMMSRDSSDWLINFTLSTSLVDPGTRRTRQNQDVLHACVCMYRFVCVPVYCYQVCFVFCLLAFLFFIKESYLQLDPHLNHSTGFLSVPWQNGSARWGLSRGGNRQPWVQGGNFSTSARETGTLRFTPGTSWEWLASQLQKKPASWSFSGEA